MFYDTLVHCHRNRMELQMIDLKDEEADNVDKAYFVISHSYGTVCTY